MGYEPIGSILNTSLAHMLQGWLEARNDSRTVAEYLADGKAGRLTPDEQAPYDAVGRHLLA